MRPQPAVPAILAIGNFCDGSGTRLAGDWCDTAVDTQLALFSDRLGCRTARVIAR